MKKRSGLLQFNEEVHEFNTLSLLLSTIATIGMLLIAILYYDAIDEMKVWSNYSFLMFAFGTIGMLSLNIYKNKKFKFSIRFKRLDPDDIYYALLTFVLLLIVQIISSLIRVYLAPENIIEILYTIFSSICEELFYRGFILGFFIYLARGYKKSILIIGLIISSGLFVSSLAFSLSHTNYYSDPFLLIIVFVSGLILGLAYIIRKDIIVPMLAHFMLNFYIVLQSGALFNALA